MPLTPSLAHDVAVLVRAVQIIPVIAAILPALGALLGVIPEVGLTTEPELLHVSQLHIAVGIVTIPRRVAVRPEVVVLNPCGWVCSQRSRGAAAVECLLALAAGALRQPGRENGRLGR